MDRIIKEDYIREMKMDEISECVNVIRNAFKTVADELGFTRENAPRFTAFATDDTRLKYQMLVEKRPMYVYLHEGKVVGYYSFGITENGNIELNNLAVLPEFRHLGIGEKLVNDASEKVKAFGKDKIEIGIVEENVKLRKWYEKLGFIHTGTKKFDFFPFTCGYMEKRLYALFRCGLQPRARQPLRLLDRLGAPGALPESRSIL